MKESIERGMHLTKKFGMSRMDHEKIFMEWGFKNHSTYMLQTVFILVMFRSTFGVGWGEGYDANVVSKQVKIQKVRI